MPTVVFEGPDGAELTNPALDYLRERILEWPSAYWEQQDGTAMLTFEDGGARNVLLILPNDQYGIYLRYAKDRDDPEKREFWLSLRDRRLLHRRIQCGRCEECHASAGLFITKEEAWLAIEEFYRTGQRTQAIEWIGPEELPEEATW